MWGLSSELFKLHLQAPNFANPYPYHSYLLVKATEWKCVVSLSYKNQTDTDTHTSVLYTFLLFDSEHKGEEAQPTGLRGPVSYSFVHT